MTAISPASPVRRETATTVRGRALVVELHPGYLTVRQKGKRRAVAVSYDAVMDLGYKLLARAEAEARRTAGKRRKRP